MGVAEGGPPPPHPPFRRLVRKCQVPDEVPHAGLHGHVRINFRNGGEQKMQVPHEAPCSGPDGRARINFRNGDEHNIASASWGATRGARWTSAHKLSEWGPHRGAGWTNAHKLSGTVAFRKSCTFEAGRSTPDGHCGAPKVMHTQGRAQPPCWT